MSNIYEPTITFDPPSNDNESEDILSLNKIDLKSLGIPEHLLTNNEPTLKIGPARSTTLHQELTDKGWYLKKSNNSYYGRIQGNKKRYEGCLYYIGGGRYDLYIRPNLILLKHQLRFSKLCLNVGYKLLIIFQLEVELCVA